MRTAAVSSAGWTMSESRQIGGGFSAHIDGAARGNPGPAAFGVVLRQGNQVLDTRREFIGRATNNVAEYRAFIAALSMACDLGVRRLQIYTDSQLLARQWSGVYRVKNPGLRPLYAEAVALARQLDEVVVTHIPREENREADRLCNMALDEVSGG